MAEENKEKEILTPAQYINKQLKDLFEPIGEPKRVRLSQANFYNFWKNVVQSESELRDFPIPTKVKALNIDEFYDELITWQDKNLLPKGVRIKIGFLDRQTVEYIVAKEIERMKQKEVERMIYILGQT